MMVVQHRVQCDQRRAFTLVEVLVALALVAAVLPVAMQAITIAIALGSSTRHRIEAASLARSKLDELMATGQWQTDSLNGDFGTEIPGYEWYAQVNNWGEGEVSQLDVTVTWTSRQHESSVTMSTLVHEGAIE